MQTQVDVQAPFPAHANSLRTKNNHTTRLQSYSNELRLRWVGLDFVRSGCYGTPVTNVLSQRVMWVWLFVVEVRKNKRYIKFHRYSFNNASCFFLCVALIQTQPRHHGTTASSWKFNMCVLRGLQYCDLVQNKWPDLMQGTASNILGTTRLHLPKKSLWALDRKKRSLPKTA